jgi:hypothetical protein
MSETTKELALGPLNRGQNDTDFEVHLENGETPNSLNVDFDRKSAKWSRGAMPLNRQSLPLTSILTRTDPALSPLSFGTQPAPFNTRSVPLRGYVYFPYNQDYDIGGGFDLEGDPLAAGTRYHNRRGRKFELNVSFRVPPDEKLYEPESRASAAPAVGAESPGFGGYSFDEGLDECFSILQKGGNRTAPMSWALAVVNVGQGLGLGAGFPASRPSNYALCWIWLDSVGWGVSDQQPCRYNLTTGQNPDLGAAAQNCSQAYRAILIHKYVVPGRRYTVAVQSTIDTGSPGNSGTNTAWAQNGSLRFWVSEDMGTPVQVASATMSGAAVVISGGAAPQMEVYKGPTDSIHYFLKYGIRYAGRDAMFAGLGQRFIPWQTCGFLPFGCDAVALENGGFQMTPRANGTVAGWYGAGIHTLTANHTNPNTYLVFNHQGLSVANTNGGASPWGQGGTPALPANYSRWQGLGGALGIVNGNPEALRNYHVVLDGLTLPVGMRGVRLRLGTYTESGASYRIDIAAPGAMPNWVGPYPALIQCFRWNQRPIEVGEVRIWSTPRDYLASSPVRAARRKMALHQTIEVDDATEPDLGSLIAYWRFDDAEGSVVTEKVVGGTRHAHLCPFGLGVVKDDIEGDNMVFFSGEGEAGTVDFSKNPIFMREVCRMLAGRSQGFAIEMSFVPTEAFYAIQDAAHVLSDSIIPPDVTPLQGSRPRFVPELLSWDVKDPPNAGTFSQPKPLITLTHRGALAGTSGLMFNFPAGFSVEVAHRSDQEDVQPIVPSDLQPIYNRAGTITTRYGLDAPWVGKRVTVQIGIQSTGVADEYDVYLAMSPKDAFFPQPGDASNAEFTHWTAGGGTYVNGGAGNRYDLYFTAAHLRISPKDLARSVLTLGRWNCRAGADALGYTELQAPMLVGKTRFFGTSASGFLPVLNGGIVATRDGKLEGANSLPQSRLTTDDILRPLGPGVRAANVVDGSVTVTPPSRARFFTAEPAVSLDAVKGSYLYVPGDEHTALERGTDGTEQEEFYLVTAVENATPATAGSTLTIGSPFADPSRTNAYAASLRLLFYTSFEDDIRDKLLTLGAGQAFIPGTTTASDVILTEDFWENLAPVTANMKLRFYSPLGRVALRDIFPRWSRGLVYSRSNPPRGGYPHKGAVYVASRGSLYEADDRWRADGPTDAITTSLALRGKPLAALVSQPLEDDRVEWTDATTALYTPSTTHLYAQDYETWVRLDDCADYQTVLWLGDPQSDPTGSAGTAAGQHKLQLIMRFNRLRPEIVLGSAAFYVGTTRPEKGLFVATGREPIEQDKWVHIRWYFATRDSGGTSVLLVPYLKVNGKTVSVTVNARDNDATITQTYDWLRTSTIVAPGSGCRMWLGVAQDGYRAPMPNVPFTSQALGINMQPQRLVGRMHALCGTLAGVRSTWRSAWSGMTTGTPPADFNPYVDDITTVISTRINAFDAMQGAGHKVWDSASEEYGTIFSHPAISVHHEFGSSMRPASFTEFGEIVYATNGGLPARIQNGHGGLAGVRAPTTAPGFRVERLTLWAPNARPRDPIATAAAGAAQQVNHYDNHGNNYLEQTLVDAGMAEIAWVNDTATNRLKMVAFKAYVRFRDTSGRQTLVSKRDGVESGAIFLECKDGCAVLGWYDQYLKKRVFVETDDVVFVPGLWHYVYFHKWWPQRDTVEGNWENEHFSNARLRRITLTGPAGTFLIGETVNGVGAGIVTKVYGAAATTVEIALAAGAELAGVITGATSAATGTVASTICPMKDKLVVRRFSTAASDHPLEAKVTGTVRNCISFVTTAGPQPAGTTATGLVSLPGLVCTGAALGIVNAAAGAQPFHGDMVGMYFQWGTLNQAAQGAGAAAPFAGLLYKITAVNSATQITVVLAGTATVPNFVSVVTASECGVFIGNALVKSQGFDSSFKPDDDSVVTYAPRYFGSPNSSDPRSGIAPFNGEFASFGFTVAHAAATVVRENAQPFEILVTTVAGANDPVFTGADTFAGAIFSGTAPGELHYDNWGAGPPQVGTWICFDCQTWGAAGAGVSSQPNKGLVVTKDATITQSAQAIDPVWKYIQAPAVMAGLRYARIAFYDVEQNEVSNPSPALAIKPDPDDLQNPSGQIRFVLTDLPVPRDQGEFEVWAYLGLSGGSDVALRRVATVPVGTREIAVNFSDTFITGLPLLDFNRGQPPRCGIIAQGQGRILYGRIESQPDGFVYSHIGQPVAIDDAPGVTRFAGGVGHELTMLHELDGLVAIAKRKGLGSVVIDDVTGLARIEIVTTGTGCIAQQSVQADQSRLYFLSDNGIEVSRRQGQTNLALPRLISSKVRKFFEEKLDRRHVDMVSAAINRKRNQYVMTARAIGAKRTNVRIAVEYDQSLVGTPVDLTEVSGYRFSVYEDPAAAMLVSVPSKDGSYDVLLCGTEHGMLMYLDSPVTALCGAGEVNGIWGFSQINSNTNKDPFGLTSISGGQMDFALEGSKGCPVRWIGDDGEEHVAICIGSEGSILHFDEMQTYPPPLQALVTVGNINHRWETPWLTFGNPHKRKEGEYLNLVAAIQKEGSILVDIYADLDQRGTSVRHQEEVDLTLPDPESADKELVISDVTGRTLKAVIRTVPMTVGQGCDLGAVIWRVHDAELD